MSTNKCYQEVFLIEAHVIIATWKFTAQQDNPITISEKDQKRISCFDKINIYLNH